MMNIPKMPDATTCSGKVLAAKLTAVARYYLDANIFLEIFVDNGLLYCCLIGGRWGGSVW